MPRTPLSKVIIKNADNNEALTPLEIFYDGPMEKHTPSSKHPSHHLFWIISNALFQQLKKILATEHYHLLPIKHSSNQLKLHKAAEFNFIHQLQEEKTTLSRNLLQLHAIKDTVTPVALEENFKLLLLLLMLNDIMRHQSPTPKKSSLKELVTKYRTLAQKLREQHIRNAKSPHTLGVTQGIGAASAEY